MRNLLTTIASLIDGQDLPALMIGGHAVTALGHPRATFDLDLLIPRSAAASWKSALLELNYQVFAESRNFLQFEAQAGIPLPPIDLMLVDDDVFETLNLTRSNCLPIATPSVLAMIALKLHAIRQPARDLVEKDWSDVIALIKAHQLTLDDPEFHAIIIRHGGEDAVNRIKSALAGGD